ncbi:Uncharacterized protein TPAR_06662 [Tolypocladium paradoxum]|uniref:Uncharacterized protein n=1 Tax=Tolypocladium paradoxum TaxID=94208 RepID=A0A2S4KSG4_9HYPO|nr:Uncharacterized protein TPAR_06662 [Tolypocladium paradoxum]
MTEFWDDAVSVIEHRLRSGDDSGPPTPLRWMSFREYDKAPRSCDEGPLLLPSFDNDQNRLNEPSGFPNERSWRLETEADMENWWHTEVSSPILSAWNRYPRIA